MALQRILKALDFLVIRIKDLQYDLSPKSLRDV